MIYNCQNPSVKIVSVEHMTWTDGFFNISPREYSALAFRIKGNAQITVDTKKYYVTVNDVLYLPQNMPYTAEYTDTEIIVIHFLTESDDTLPQVYSVANSEQIYKAFLNAYTIWKNKLPGYEAYTMSQLYYILGQICEKEAAVILPESFIKAVSYININFKRPGLTVDEICRNSCISATGIRQLFRQHYKKTPVEYITELRLEYARALISCGTSVEKASFESGFNDPKYFARIVKKNYSCTPRELKKYGK